MTADLWAVTGAAGFLGANVVEQLLARGNRVLAVDDLTTGRAAHLCAHTLNPHFAQATLDIRDAAALAALFAERRPDVVVHLAALHFIPACVADPTRTVSVNVVGTQSVLSAARAAGVARFGFASTADVYAPAGGPLHEVSSPTGPFNIYGLTKLVGEQLVALDSRGRPNARFVVARLFNLVGPRETNPHFLPEIVRQLRERPGQPLRLGDLTPTRDLVPVADAARALIALLDAAPVGVTTANVGTGVAWSMRQVLDRIGDLLGAALVVETDPAKLRPAERQNLRADVSRLRAMVGFTPSADLRATLAELLRSEGLLP